MVLGGRRERGSGCGTRVYLWRIHVDVWQDSTHFQLLHSDEDAWNDFSFSEFSRARFMAQAVIYPGEGSVCA